MIQHQPYEHQFDSRPEISQLFPALNLISSTRRCPVKQATMAKLLRWTLLAAMYFEAALGAFDDGICKSIVQAYGYRCQEYTVTTKDGYILSMQRIQQYQCNISRKRQPVLLQHGILMDGVAWLMGSPDQSLAYILADNGFDVWISNTRGTRWSRRHVSLHANDPVYWNWSWDELLEYDLLSFSEFVHKETGQKLHYVGDSLGTLTALAALSQGMLVDILKSAALLSPIAHLNHVTSPVRPVALPSCGDSIYWLAMPEFNPKGLAVTMLIDSICVTQRINCYDLISTFTGKNCCLNSSGVGFFFKYEPQSTSTRNIIHLDQMMQSGNIAKYDYGSFFENIQHYGKIQPPKYDMSCIPKDFPLFLSYGGEDPISDVQDVKILLDDLKSHDGDKLVVKFVRDYAHMDFVMAINAKQTIYDPLIGFFNRHSNP